MMCLFNPRKYLSLFLIAFLFSLGLFPEDTLARPKNKRIVAKRKTHARSSSHHKVKQHKSSKQHSRKSRRKAGRRYSRRHRRIASKYKRNSSITSSTPRLSKASPHVQIPTDRTTEIQQALKRAGYYSGEITGDYDSTTRSAMSNFQRANGLKDTGTPTAQSLAKLGLTKPSTSVVKELPPSLPPTTQEEPQEQQNDN